MKAIIVMFDSLNRHVLPSYGHREAIAPHFTRLKEQSVQFEKSYVCSMPCMPARREFHTSRPNFLHTKWGPLEPYDDSFIRMLSREGVYTHLCTDHHHYFEDGGAFYHTTYDSWEFFRGQEDDPWNGVVERAEIPEQAVSRNARPTPKLRQNYANRKRFEEQRVLPFEQTFDAGLKFLEQNHESDNWLLQIETFAPHEPFLSDDKFKELNGITAEQREKILFDWPPYSEVSEEPEAVQQCRKEYLSCLTQCDANLGRVLDFMDSHEMWEDTLLIVWTDHGFLLGEHDWWSKICVPWWEEAAHTPFYVWDPRLKLQGVSCQALVQPALDIAPTVLDFFGLQATADMTGHDLHPVMETGESDRDFAIFGSFHGQVNITDGRYTYMRAAQDLSVRLYEYRLLPYDLQRTVDAQLYREKQQPGRTFSFTKGVTLPKWGLAESKRSQEEIDLELSKNHPLTHQNLCYDLVADPFQQDPASGASEELRLTEALHEALVRFDAPDELLQRLGLTFAPAAV